MNAKRKELTLSIVGISSVSMGSGFLFIAYFLFPGFDVPLPQLTLGLFLRYIGAAFFALGGIFLISVGMNIWEDVKM